MLATVAVGTPGRTRQLLASGALSVNDVRVFVLDEAGKTERQTNRHTDRQTATQQCEKQLTIAHCTDFFEDRLMQHPFIEDVRAIGTALPTARQTLAFSATFSGSTTRALAPLMHAPHFVSVGEQLSASFFAPLCAYCSRNCQEPTADAAASRRASAPCSSGSGSSVRCARSKVARVARADTAAGRSRLHSLARSSPTACSGSLPLGNINRAK